MNKEVIRYCIIGSYKQGVKKHPKTVVKNLGVIVHDFHGMPVSDCVFMLVSKLPDNLPEYINRSNFIF